MSQNLATTIGKAVLKGRRELGLTQEEAAERLSISVHYYGRIERGMSLPSVTTLQRMAVVLRLKGDALLGL
ncbi:helix-turn-helix domain-containing protein [Haliangium ochraceum]|uniref:Transcriptional regulator, XRE family n=1 Tax=Haliangium ochraceum (strain DSM 14365 / JCM 11303 / SMP-2) TaxID=502025 RepID=D0LLK0_HALO1|nr:helix-turn-helix transcriptional regulator [Haliangium ochraceum]ACY13217.1 transcriptional regulator, XRE family [Haliangium ochraceum DSM 14365]